MDKGNHKVRIESVKRIENSYVGNPRFELYVSTQGFGSFHTMRTAANASMNHSIGNKGFKELDIVTIHVNGRGTIDKMVSADGELA